jgi:hypothetical protein
MVALLTAGDALHPKQLRWRGKTRPTLVDLYLVLGLKSLLPFLHAWVLSYPLEDLERELERKALRASTDRIVKAAESLGGSARIYVTNAVRREIVVRVPLVSRPKMEIFIFFEEPFTRMSIFDEGRYAEVERQAFNLPSVFVSVWFEDSEGKRHFGKSLIPRSLGFIEVELSVLASSEPEVYREARTTAAKFIALL